MVNFFALMLWAAAGFAFLGGMPQLGVAVSLVVIFNGVFAFVQEYRAERAAERIRDLLPRRATVIRDGSRHLIDASDLVRGDLVYLEAGDRISADLRVVEAHTLRIDTSLLTGESEPEPNDNGDALFAGTFVVEGEGRAIVEHVGTSTRLAGISELTRTTKRPATPLTKELHRVVRTIAVIALSFGALFLVVSLPLGQPLSRGFTFAIGVTVALVPNALLPTVTVSLAVGAQRMARRHALVRRLDSVETLGSTTFICTDKTGTLTQNLMQVVEVWTPTGRAAIEGIGYEPSAEITVAPEAREGLVAAVRASRICSTGRAVEREGRWIARGDPMEAAIDTLSRRLDVADLVPDVVRRFPFDPRRRRMSVVADGHVFVKGAPDAILDRCRDVANADEALHGMAERGLRVLAVASRAVRSVDAMHDADDAEHDLDLLGLLALQDPPRGHVGDDIAACRRSGMKVAMVTGDHPATAKAIAREVGLLGAEEIVLMGTDLPADDAGLGEVVDRDGIVLARISPEEKLRIAKALRARGHVVAMTGDGVNDGPALQEADIGVAMGASGTDVAREAADLVLLDDDFSTIVDAIRYGRATFLNVRRFLTYHLTDNVAELTPFVLWALSAGRFPLAIGVLQVLALDIGTDTLPAIALGAEEPAASVLDREPLRGRLLDGLVARRAFGVLGPIESILSMIAFVVARAAGAQMGSASGAAFAVIVIGQLTNAFCCRSTTRPPWVVGWLGNRLLLIAVAIELAVTASFVFVGAIARALGQAPPTLVGWLFVVGAAPTILIADRVEKAIRTRRRSVS